MNFARTIFRLTPVLLECSTTRAPFIVSASYSVKSQYRKPFKVFESDGVTEIENPTFDKPTNQRFKTKDGIKGVIELDKTNFRNQEFVDKDSVENENDDEDTLLTGTSYTRLGDTDNKFAHMVAKTQSRRQRLKSNIFSLEGKRLIQEAITAGVTPISIFFSRKSLVEELEMPPGEIELYKIPYNKIKKWSSLETPPGIVAFCKIPKRRKLENRSNDVLPITLICDNVREPGNLGTIIRTFSGAGCSDIFLTRGCTDAWDSKVLRGAAGAHFHTSITSDLTWDELNKQIGKEAKIFIAHHDTAASQSAEEQMLMTIPYYSVNYSCLKEVVIIVGGETEGISVEAVNFTRYRDGLKINIPLSNNIESLNVGAAVSAILFEIKRQFLQNRTNTSMHDKLKNVAIN